MIKKEVENGNKTKYNVKEFNFTYDFKTEKKSLAKNGFGSPNRQFNRTHLG